MSLSDRDRKLLLIIVPVVLVAAYWFLLLAPKREAASQAQAEAAAQEERRDTAKAQLDQADSAKTDFAADYGEIVRLGKAIPAKVDMPSLLVQLEGAAEGTGIRFTRIGTGERAAAPVQAAAPPSPGSEPGSSTTPAAAGGQPAQSPAGSAAETAGNAAAASDQASQAAEQSGVDAQTSTSTGEGGLPVGGGAGGPSGDTATAAPVGLETVPLELEFTGDFFNLADFFHDVKRFVRVVNSEVVVSGRLVTVDGIRFASDPELFPGIRAELTATIYLSPKAQGATAGATPQGPPSTTPASSGSTPSPSASPAPAPTAAATP